MILQCNGLPNEGRQPARQRLEHGVDVSGGDSGAEFIHQRVVRREVQGLAQQRRFVAHQMHDLLQMRRENLELALLTRFQPTRLGA